MFALTQTYRVSKFFFQLFYSFYCSGNRGIVRFGTVIYRVKLQFFS